MTATEAHATTPAPDAVRRPHARDPYFDNARAILMVLVLVGHLVQPLTTASADGLYDWIYAFHMPAFVLITGFMCRSYTGTPRQATSLVMTLLIPYGVFQVINAIERTVWGGAEFTVSFFTPAWGLWFPLALILWRLFLPMIRVLKYPLIFAVAISLLAPMDPHMDQLFSMAKVLGFLPFFVAGLLMKPEWFEWFKTRAARIVGAVVLVAALPAAVLVEQKFSSTVFLLSSTYSSNGDNTFHGVLIRAAVLVAGFAGTAALLAVTPTGHRWFTVVGVNSLTVYMLQCAIVFPFRTFDPFLSWFHRQTDLWPTIAVAVAAAALALLLGTPLVERATRWIVRPPVERLVIARTPLQPVSSR
jgi:fucose 4-O-acetylase-like acetyltransferase